MSILEGPVAQRLERAAHNRLVAGSIPAGPTIFSSKSSSRPVVVSLLKGVIQQSL